MSAMLQLNRELLDRRNMAVLQITMQSQRASVLEKQAAELALLRIWYNRSALSTKRAWAQADATEAHNYWLQEILFHAVADQRRVNDNLQQLVDDYWALIDDCVDVGYETKENSRGQKRKLPATEELKKIRKIICEHNGYRARMVVAAVTGAGSSTDRR